jgi:hypothetical protein
MKLFRGSISLAIAVALSLAAFTAAAEITREDIMGKAKKALADKGVAVVDCHILYDEQNKRWEEWGLYLERTPNDANHGLLPHGILASKKYQAVYFDFYDDSKKDAWVFVDLLTGDVLGIYEEK